ncbi:hypothetical protein D3C73_749140 [compost metagenome]
MRLRKKGITYFYENLRSIFLYICTMGMTGRKKASTLEGKSEAMVGATLSFAKWAMK